MIGAAALLAGSCGHHPPTARPSAAEARAHHYQDSSGLLARTYGAWLRQGLPGGTTAELKALADYVRLEPDDPTSPHAHHHGPDAVTSASATAAGGEVASEWRFEGQAGLDVAGEVAGAPASVGVLARASTEPDYKSVAAAAQAMVELGERNTTLSLLLGYGRDRVEPVEVFRGEEAQWPASHDRITGTLSIAQLVSPVAIASAGLAGTWQRGTLSSPYRRAVVGPSLLLPEALPRARDRFSGFLGLSMLLTPRFAVHFKQGVYADSWSVRAFIPEVTLAVEPAPRILVQAGYRFYLQSSASFHQVTYDDVRPVMTGDPRLGRVRDHTLGLEVRRSFGPSAHLALPILLGYQLSTLDYLDRGSRVVAHVFTAGAGAEY